MSSVFGDIPNSVLMDRRSKLETICSIYIYIYIERERETVNRTVQCTVLQSTIGNLDDTGRIRTVK